MAERSVQLYQSRYLSIPMPRGAQRKLAQFSTMQFHFSGKYCIVKFAEFELRVLATSQWICSVAVFLDSKKIIRCSDEYPVIEVVSKDFVLHGNKLTLNAQLKGSLEKISLGVIHFRSEPLPSIIDDVELFLRWKAPLIRHDMQTYQRITGKKSLSLLHEGSYCDVVLSVQDQEISAHRITLAAHSSVFKTMFDTEMLENKSGRVEVRGFEPEAVKLMIEFMYSPTEDSCVFSSFDLAMETYKCAHMYEVDMLKHRCSIYLQREISETNALDILQLAGVFEDTPLKEFALKYIFKHPKSSKEKVKCESVIGTCPELFHFILQTHEFCEFDNEGLCFFVNN